MYLHNKLCMYSIFLFTFCCVLCFVYLFTFVCREITQFWVAKALLIYVAAPKIDKSSLLVLWLCWAKHLWRMQWGVNGVRHTNFSTIIGLEFRNGEKWFGSSWLFSAKYLLFQLVLFVSLVRDKRGAIFLSKVTSQFSISLSTWKLSLKVCVCSMLCSSWCESSVIVVDISAYYWHISKYLDLINCEDFGLSAKILG